MIDLKAVVRPIEQSAGIETLLWNDGEEAVFEAAARGVVEASTPFAVARARSSSFKPCSSRGMRSSARRSSSAMIAW